MLLLSFFCLSLLISMFSIALIQTGEFKLFFPILLIATPWGYLLQEILISIFS